MRVCVFWEGEQPDDSETEAGVLEPMEETKQEFITVIQATCYCYISPRELLSQPVFVNFISDNIMSNQTGLDIIYIFT